MKLIYFPSSVPPGTSPSQASAALEYEQKTELHCSLHTPFDNKQGTPQLLGLIRTAPYEAPSQASPAVPERTNQDSVSEAINTSSRTGEHSQRSRRR